MHVYLLSYGGGGGGGAGGVASTTHLGHGWSVLGGGGGGGGSGYFKTVTGYADANSHITVTVGQGGQRGFAGTSTSMVEPTAGSATVIKWINQGNEYMNQANGGKPGLQGADASFDGTAVVGSGGDGGDGGYGGGGGGGANVIEYDGNQYTSSSAGLGGQGQQIAMSGTDGGTGFLARGPGGNGGGNSSSNEAILAYGSDGGTGGGGGGPQGGWGGMIDSDMWYIHGFPASDHSGCGGGGGGGGYIYTSSDSTGYYAIGSDGGNGAPGYCVFYFYPAVSECNNNNETKPILKCKKTKKTKKEKSQGFLSLCL